MPTQPHARQAIATTLALIAVLATAAGCDREAPAAAPPAILVAPSKTPPKPTYTLIMTWMYAAQPPQTTQTVFRDQTACDQARDAAIAEGRRLALESFGDAPAAAAAKPAPPPAPRRYIGSALLPSDDTAPPPPTAASAPQSTPPKVAAICAATSTP